MRTDKPPGPQRDRLGLLLAAPTMFTEPLLHRPRTICACRCGGDQVVRQLAVPPGAEWRRRPGGQELELGWARRRSRTDRYAPGAAESR
jgi:hypothetical protein